MSEMVAMDGVREYCEAMPVEIGPYAGGDPNNFRDEEYARGRVVIIAFNEAGYNSTQVDLRDLLGWLRGNRPDLLEEFK